MISIVVRVRDANTKRFIYTHETEDHTAKRFDEIKKIYCDVMTGRFIITLASLHAHKSFTLCLPIGFQCDKECKAVTITYYVKECS
jgi:hypothetical protein